MKLFLEKKIISLMVKTEIWIWIYCCRVYAVSICSSSGYGCDCCWAISSAAAASTAAVDDDENYDYYYLRSFFMILILFEYTKIFYTNTCCSCRHHHHHQHDHSLSKVELNSIEFHAGPIAGPSSRPIRECIDEFKLKKSNRTST